MNLGWEEFIRDELKVQSENELAVRASRQTQEHLHIPHDLYVIYNMIVTTAIIQDSFQSQ